METKEFKKLFSGIAKKNDFTFESNSFFKESDRSLVALILRKSNFSKLYYLRIKVHLKTSGEKDLNKSEWIKHDVADILLGASEKFTKLFDLENQIADTARTDGIESLFDSELNDLIRKALTQEGLLDLHNSRKILTLPSTRLKLGID